MRIPSRRTVVSGAVALAFVVGVGWTALLQHQRASEALQASIEALEEPRQACEASYSSMLAELHLAEDAVAATPLPGESVEVESLALTVDAAAKADGCDMGPGDSVDANEEYARWLRGSAVDAQMLEDALAGGQEALAAAEAEQQAADALAGHVADAQRVADEARTALASTEGEVADDAVRAALATALATLDAALAVEPPEDADAAWYVSQSDALAGLVDEVTAASGAVQASHEEWVAAQAKPATASGTTGSSGSGTTSATVTKGSAVEFCAALNAARTGNGVAAFGSCGESGAQVAHAKEMATAGTVWHTGNENIVGYASSYDRLIAAFMDSADHRELILTGGSPAQVGCYWREGSPDYLYCSAAFTW
ncbi:hypothetical protein [Demequina sp. NBRC 110052]|uniref:hypothetical protein n=1 Tax=Demequina sp. NBRC 110052 TaxID=1570341 RepID=UPI0009FE2F5D|nr:hypothetical protein [Demequina sp. NBRC 110052]